MMSTATALALEYLELTEALETAKAEKARLEGVLAKKQRPLIKAFKAEGVTRIRAANGREVVAEPSLSIPAPSELLSLPGGEQAIKRAGLGDLIKQTIHAGAFRKAVRERIICKENKALPVTTAEAVKRMGALGKRLDVVVEAGVRVSAPPKQEEPIAQVVSEVREREPIEGKALINEAVTA